MQMFSGIVAYAMKMYCSISCSTHRRLYFSAVIQSTAEMFCYGILLKSSFLILAFFGFYYQYAKLHVNLHSKFRIEIFCVNSLY